MVALYRAGRQPEALESFRAGRTALRRGLRPRAHARAEGARVPGAAAGPRARRSELTATRAGQGGVAARCCSRRATARSWTGSSPSGGAWPALGRHELLLTQAVESEASLADAVAATRARRDELATGGITRQRSGVRVARLRSGHGAARADARRRPDGGRRLAGDRVRRIRPGSLALLLERSPCDVALLAGLGAAAVRGRHRRAVRRGRPRLGGRGARSLARRRRLGAPPAHRRERSRRPADASRLLASASIAIQQVVGIDVEPVLADAGARRPVAAARLGRGDGRGAVAPLAAGGSRRVAARAPRGRLADARRAPRRAPRRPRAARAADPVHLDDRRAAADPSRAGRARRGRRN